MSSWKNLFFLAILAVVGWGLYVSLMRAPAPVATAPPGAENAATAPPTVVPTVVPSQSLEGATATPTTAPTKTPTQGVEAATSAPSATVPATSSGGAPGGGSGSPLFALLIALVFGGLGFMAVEAQRRSTRG